MGLSSHISSTIVQPMTLVVDLGQSGSRVRIEGKQIDSERGKLNGEAVIDSLLAVFQNLPKSQLETAALACTGFNGIVSDPQPFLALCNEFFGATKVAVIDDGLAGFVGALGGSNGVVLSIGGGVVSVGGNNSHFAHRDGLGSTFGDEGGGFWLGKLGLTRALGIRQGRGNDQVLLGAFKDQVFEFDALKVKNAAEASTLAITSAKNLLSAADAGSPTAIAIRNEGAALLAQTVIATWQGAGGSLDDAPEIAIQGGPSKNPGYVSAIQNNISRSLPKAKFVSARGDNLDGALWIAENMSQDAEPLLRWASKTSS
jgi:N-acetylglucosamine kinase-like BadF-type ATPase